MTEITTLATPKVINEAMDAVEDPETPVEDRAAYYGLLYEIKRRIDRSLGTYQRGQRTAKTDLQNYLVGLQSNELGPLYLAWESFGVEWPCNEPGNWEDTNVQESMAVIAALHPEFVRFVPKHYEINTAALGEAVHTGNREALQLHSECKQRGWRTEGGKRAVLRVREVKAPKGKAA